MTNLSFEHSQTQRWEISHFVDFFVKIPKIMVISAGTRRQCTFFEEKVGIFGFDFSSLCLSIDGSACQLMQNFNHQNQTNSNFLFERSNIFKKKDSEVILLDLNCEVIDSEAKKVLFAKFWCSWKAKCRHLPAPNRLKSLINIS